MHFVPSRDGLNVPSFDAEYFIFPPLLSSIPWFSHFFQGAAAAAAGRGSIVHGRARVVYHLYLVDVPVYALMPFAFLRQGTSPSPQRGGLCEAHRIGGPAGLGWAGPAGLGWALS